jgi:hypothetical protein
VDLRLSGSVAAARAQVAACPQNGQRFRDCRISSIPSASGGPMDLPDSLVMQKRGRPRSGARGAAVSSSFREDPQILCGVVR